MSISEISILVVALLPLLYRGWNGWRYGATTEFRHLLVNFFALLVAIRYWQPVSETVSGGLTFDPRWVAVSSFILLYIAGAAIAGFAVKLKAQAYQSVKPDYSNKGLGLLAGVGSGLLLGAGVLWLAMVAQPGRFAAVAPAKFLSEQPRAIVRDIETQVGVAAESAGRTRYPLVTLVEMPAESAAGPAPEGAVLMQQRGRIGWQP